MPDYSALQNILNPTRKVITDPTEAVSTRQGMIPSMSPEIALASLRDQRKGELEEAHIADPGNTRLAGLLGILKGDIASDPSTGDAARKIHQAYTQYADPEATYTREHVARDVTAAEQAKAHAESYGKATGSQEAELSDQGQAVAQHTLERAQTLKQTPVPVPGQYSFPPTGSAGGVGGVGGVGSVGETGGLPPNLKPLSQKESGSLDALHTAAPLIGELEQTLGQGDQGGNAFSNRLAYYGYKAGMAPDTIQSIPGVSPHTNKRIQLAGLLRIMGAAPYMAGSRSFQLLKQAEEHLTDPGAADAQVSARLQELKALWPRLQQELIQAHISPGAPINFAPYSSSESDWQDVK